MEIKIFGSGCAKCKSLEKNAAEAVKIMGVEASVIKITDLSEIMAEGVMMTPGLMVDGVLLSTGKLLNPQEIVDLIKKESDCCGGCSCNGGCC
ncbi:MAG: TM0996/MTH895 family glutaredoxin-like protein [Spirochaetales bacterium]|nr:TM0996/MTH895 family glutaredoxin-like protein [Spirochaetales bacterium]